MSFAYFCYTQNISFVLRLLTLDRCDFSLLWIPRGARSQIEFLQHNDSWGEEQLLEVTSAYLHWWLFMPFCGDSAEFQKIWDLLFHSEFLKVCTLNFQKSMWEIGKTTSLECKAQKVQGWLDFGKRRKWIQWRQDYGVSNSIRIPFWYGFCPLRMLVVGRPQLNSYSLSPCLSLIVPNAICVRWHITTQYSCTIRDAFTEEDNIRFCNNRCLGESVCDVIYVVDINANHKSFFFFRSSYPSVWKFPLISPLV